MKGNNREALLCSSPRPSNISIDLQMNLLNTWTKHKIPDDYQNLFLAYLDEQPVDIAESEMKKQVKQTIEKRTLFFKVQTLEDQRINQLNQIENLLSNSNTPTTSEELTAICEEVKTLRIINLQLAEALVKMYDSFKCYTSDSIQKQTYFFEPYLDRLNSQNKIVRQSVLGKYINFGSGYDPFLMEYYEQFHRNHGQNTEPSIKELFQLNISLVYRLLKTKNALLEMKSKMQPEQKVSQSVAYLKAPSREVGKVKNYRQRGYSLEQVRKPIKTETVPSRNDYSLEKVTPIKITPIQVFPARTTIYSPQRLNSPSYTEGPSNDFMQSRINQRKLDPIQNEISHKNQRRSNKVYLETESSDYQTLYNSFQPNQPHKQYMGGLDSYRKDESYAKPQIIKLKPYKLTPITYKPEGENQSVVSHHSQSIIYSQQIKRKEQEKIKNNDSKQPKQEPENLHPQNYLQNKLKQFKNLAAADYQVKNYNPIKKNQYQLIKRSQKTSKYDYVLITNAYTQLSQVDEQGLDIQTPIYKYNKKNPAKKSAAYPSLIDQLTLPRKISKNTPKKEGEPPKQSLPQRSSQQNLNKNEKQREKSVLSSNKPDNKVNQQCQTIQSQQVIIQKAPEKQNSQPRQRRDSQISKQANAKPMKQQVSQYQSLPNNPAPTQKKSDQKMPVQSKPGVSSLDQTLQNEDIVDDRPAQKINRNEPLIKTVPKDTGANQNTNNANPKTNPNPNTGSNLLPPQQPKANESNVVISTKQSQKKEIKMKVGKSTLSELLSLLQTSPISPQTKTLFSFDKLIQWLKVGQTYLIQFHVNNECAVIALCSPIPGIGMALKLWAPIHPTIDSAASSNLFQKYIEFIQKSTTVEKILFSGNGEALKELKAGEFIQKKENLYERVRKLPPKKIQFEFKPFLYVECSSAAFNQAQNGTLLFSQEIQQFSLTNHYCSNILSDNNPSIIPKTLLPFIKITENVKDFAEVNKILTAEQFDNYEAGEVKASSINLLRLFANTPFKSSFIANEGFLQFVGILLHQNQKECLISIPTSKYNGVIYFAKNMDLKSMIGKCKAASGNNKVKFNIKMFHKALYGKLLNRPKGSYGNWEINLTWQDQMQGKVKHPLPQGRCFGPESFLVGIEIEKELLLCAEINKDDFIY